MVDGVLKDADAAVHAIGEHMYSQCIIEICVFILKALIIFVNA